eukprot:Gb_02160 [translate_table: standard]
MVGAVSVLGAIGDVHEPFRSFITEARLNKNAVGRGRHRGTSVPLSSSLTDAWQDCRLTARVFTRIVQNCSPRHQERHSPVVVDEIAGQYEENFDDVEKSAVGMVPVEHDDSMVIEIVIIWWQMPSPGAYKKTCFTFDSRCENHKSTLLIGSILIIDSLPVDTHTVVVPLTQLPS